MINADGEKESGHSQKSKSIRTRFRLLKHNTSSESCHSSSLGPSPSPSLFSFSSSSLSPPDPPPRPFFGDLVAPSVHIPVWLFTVDGWLFLGLAGSPSLALDHHVRPCTRISLRIDRLKRMVGRYRHWTIHRFNVWAHATMRIKRNDKIIGDGHTCTSAHQSSLHANILRGEGQLWTKQSYRVSFLK